MSTIVEKVLEIKKRLFSLVVCEQRLLIYYRGNSTDKFALRNDTYRYLGLRFKTSITSITSHVSRLGKVICRGSDSILGNLSISKYNSA